MWAWIAAPRHPVVITDAEGRVLAINAAFGRLFGISESCLPDEPVEDLVIASRFRAAYRAMRRLVLTGGPSGIAGSMTEFAAVRADGGEFPVSLSFARANDDPHRLATRIRPRAGHSTVATRTPREKTLRERTEELAGFGSWDWNPESGRLRWSNNLFRIYGLRPAEITPSAEYVIAHCHPDDAARVKAAAGDLGRTRQLQDLRYRYVWPDRTVRHLEATVVSPAKAGVGPRMLSGTVQDVTEQHQTELELAARFAVSDALSGWKPGAAGARRLVRDLAEALEFDLGVLWVPRGDVLVAWEVWQAPGSHTPRNEADLSQVRLERGQGLAGSAWASGEPARVTDLNDEASTALEELDTRTGLYGSLAVPATYGDEVLAVLAFASRRQAVLADQFMRSVLGIGYEIGRFLAGRRSEFCTPVLSPRELQVLQLSATGYARRQTAEELELSEATVKTHMAHIYNKLGVPDRASAVAEALRQGLIH
jgi:PAS domain S-box-containing protein